VTTDVVDEAVLRFLRRREAPNFISSLEYREVLVAELLEAVPRGKSSRACADDDDFSALIHFYACKAGSWSSSRDLIASIHRSSALSSDGSIDPRSLPRTE